MSVLGCVQSLMLHAAAVVQQSSAVSQVMWLTLVTRAPARLGCTLGNQRLAHHGGLKKTVVCPMSLKNCPRSLVWLELLELATGQSGMALTQFSRSSRNNVCDILLGPERLVYNTD